MPGKILVAGGSGFIGSHIVAELWKAGEDVAVLSRDPSRARKNLTTVDVNYIKGDVRNPSSLAKALKGITTIVSCVQFPNHPVENPRRGFTYEKIDGEGTRNLVDAAREAGMIERFVYVSGAGVHKDRPPSDREPWFKAKIAAENAITNSTIPYTIFRPSWVYGRQDRSLNRFIDFAQSLPFVPVIGPGTNRVQPLFIMDLAQAIARAVRSPRAANQIYEIGGPEMLSMDEIIHAVLKILGKQKPIIHQPVGLMKTLARVLSILPSRPLTPQAIDFILMEEPVDNAKILGDFDLKLTHLEDALRTYVTSPGAEQPPG